MKKELESGNWLTDEHIALAQVLLKSEYPHIVGFQPTVLSQNDGFVPVRSSSESLQIHHTNGNHWVMSTTIGGEVTVVDSSWHDHLSSSLTHQLAHIYRAFMEDQEDDEDDGYEGYETSLAVSIPRVQQQGGASDCGLFAIAFAVHILRGDKIEDVEFDQRKMRSHLSSCFRKKQLLPFPTLKQPGYRLTRYFPYVSLSIYCYCKMPETYGDMVQCDDCDEWYHMKCVEVESSGIAGKWLCRACSAEQMNS